MMAVSRGLRASNSSTTRGRPPVISLVLVVSRGILASTSPACTSSLSRTIRWAWVGIRYFLASERDPEAPSGRTTICGCFFSSGESVTTSCDMPVTSSNCSCMVRPSTRSLKWMVPLTSVRIEKVVGRGSPFLLREREDTFSVFTYAPHDEKIRRLVAVGRSREEAEDLVENVDKERMAYIKHYFNNEWPTRSLYHLMINTAVGDENVVATILSCMQTFAAHPGEIALRGIRRSEE